MKTTRDIALTAVMTALLLGGQLALSMVAGVEIVSILLLTFSMVFGPVRGISVALLFSIIRCFIFGTFIAVVILYLIYYPLFALVFGMLGNYIKKRGKLCIRDIVIVCILCAAMTACFTLLDNIIYPLIAGFGPKSTRIYFLASLPVMALHTATNTVITAILFPKLYDIMRFKIKKSLSSK